MTFDEAIDALATGDGAPLEAVGWLREHWQESASRCRALLAAFASGADQSERTGKALEFLVPLLADEHDQEAFPHICQLLLDPEKSDLALHEEMLDLTAATILINTYNGDPAPLHALVRSPAVDGMRRADVLLVLGYLARTGRLAESELYPFLLSLPAELAPQAENLVWFGWVRVVAALGFTGGAVQAEKLFRQGRVDEDLFNLSDFWADLNASRVDPGSMTSPAWDDLQLVDNLFDAMQDAPEEDSQLDQPLEPIRNPLRNIGRNDPCPCGSGKKYKRCCLVP